MTTQVPDLYRTLGVGRDATTEAIEAAYTGWQARLSAGEPISTQEWERLRYAHEVLSNPQRRSLYDSLVAETTVSSLDLSVAVSAARLPLLATPQVVLQVPVESWLAAHTA